MLPDPPSRTGQGPGALPTGTPTECPASSTSARGHRVFYCGPAGPGSYSAASAGSLPVALSMAMVTLGPIVEVSAIFCM